MPILKNKNQHVKVYRPRGTRYAAGRHPVLAHAIGEAQDNFIKEHRYVPENKESVYEVVWSLGSWEAVLYEIKP